MPGTLLVHLSDLHLRTDQPNVILGRTSKILAVAEHHLRSADTCVIAVTGDIAYSGAPEEYELARSLFGELKEGLARLPGPARGIHFAFAPGNHDCDFRASEARDLLLERLTPDEQLNPSAAIMRTLTDNQRFYRDFVRSFVGASEADDARISSRTVLELDGLRLSLTSINTAWLSTKHEQPGKLTVPVALLQGETDVDLAIALTHHPHSWLAAPNAKSVLGFMEQNYDIVLSGHEHDGQTYIRGNHGTPPVDYVEGAVLQAHSDQNLSGFNCILIDSDSSTFSLELLDWDERTKSYGVASRTDRRPFLGALRRGSEALEPTPSFVMRLTDLGTKFTHPRAASLQLSDLFVYPDLEDRPSEGRGKDLGATTVYSDDVVKHLLKHKKILLVGTELSGKTAFVRAYYQDLISTQIYPVLLQGRSLRSGVDRLAEAIDTAVVEQYGRAALTQFQQLPTKSRALLIDDYGSSALQGTDSRQLIDYLERSFDYVLFVVSDLFLLEEAARTRGESSLKYFRQCQIKEYGHRLRGRLIEKWHRLGLESDADDATIELQIAQTERAVDTLLGRNLLPSVPLFIFTVTQTIEAGTSLNTAVGTYGYVYEALITGALSSGFPKVTLDAKYTYIAALALDLFSSGRTRLLQDRVEAITAQYLAYYRVRLTPAEILPFLVKASILEQDGEGWRFRYPYIEYYFIAKGLQEANQRESQGPWVWERLQSLASTVHQDRSANILIFYLYLTKDVRLIGHLLSSAKELLKEFEPCNLTSHTARFVGAESISLETKSRERAKEDFRRNLDENGDLLNGGKEIEVQDSEERQPGLEFLLQLNSAFKTLQLLGQIARNFPGSLSGEIKLALTQECYLLGLRTLRMLFLVFEEHRADLRSYVRAVLLERGHEEGDSLERAADRLLFMFAAYIAHSLIRRIGFSVGSKHLTETYADVLSQNEMLSIRIVDASIRLDNIRPIPDSTIIDLYDDEAHRHPLASTVLRKLVADHLLLFHCDYKVRQRLCARLKLQPSGAMVSKLLKK